MGFPLIHLRIQNGECGRFWIDNWSPYGSLREYLDGDRSRLGIPKDATLASLYRNGAWRIPARRNSGRRDSGGRLVSGGLDFSKYPTTKLSCLACRAEQDSYTRQADQLGPSGPFTMPSM